MTEDHLGRAVRTAEEAVGVAGRGPFGAVVARGDEVVGEGANRTRISRSAIVRECEGTGGASTPSRLPAVRYGEGGIRTLDRALNPITV